MIVNMNKTNAFAHKYKQSEGNMLEFLPTINTWERMTSTCTGSARWYFFNGSVGVPKNTRLSMTSDGNTYRGVTGGYAVERTAGSAGCCDAGEDRAHKDGGVAWLAPMASYEEICEVFA